MDKTTHIILIILCVAAGFIVGEILFRTEPEPPPPEPCIEVIKKERTYVDGDWITVWTIDGVEYLVRWNEIVGRLERFYTEDGRRR